MLKFYKFRVWWKRKNYKSVYLSPNTSIYVAPFVAPVQIAQVYLPAEKPPRSRAVWQIALAKHYSLPTVFQILKICSRTTYINAKKLPSIALRHSPGVDFFYTVVWDWLQVGRSIRFQKIIEEFRNSSLNSRCFRFFYRFSGQWKTC